MTIIIAARRRELPISGARGPGVTRRSLPEIAMVTSNAARASTRHVVLPEELEQDLAQLAETALHDRWRCRPIGACHPDFTCNRPSSWTPVDRRRSPRGD